MKRLHAGLLMAGAGCFTMLASAYSAGWIPWFGVGLGCVAIAVVLGVAGIEQSGRALGGGGWQRPTRSGWAVLALLVVVHVTTAVLLERSVTGDDIDTYTFQKQAAGLLLQGKDPYGTTQANVFNDHDTALYYGPGMVLNGRVQVGFQYPPLTILWALPGYLLGDVRYSYILAVVVAAVFGFLAFPGRGGLWFAGFLLVNPVGFNVENRAWTEPLVLMLLAVSVYAAVKKRWWLPVAVGLFLASKQYNFLALPLLGFLVLPLGWARYWRMLGVACCVGIATVLPFAVWNFGALWHDIVLFHLAQPFRDDALSFAVLWPGMMQVGLVLAGACVVWVLGAGQRSVAMFAAAYGMVLLLFVATSKQAFCNYYFLIGETLLLAAAGWWTARQTQIPFGNDNKRAVTAGR
jgi:hypothetical protein